MLLYAGLEEPAPAEPPSRPIQPMVDQALPKPERTLEEIYGEAGRPPIAPERLLRAQFALLYSMRSEPMLIEQWRYHLRLRWFVGLGMNAGEMAREIPGGAGRVRPAADKAYDRRDCVGHLRELKVTPYVAHNNSKRARAVDGRTTRHEGYWKSQRRRKLVEEFFGRAKVAAG